MSLSAGSLPAESLPAESLTGRAYGDGRAARLDRCLTELLAQAPELEAAAVVSFDGLPMASALPPSMDEDRVAAMSAALLSLGEKAAHGLGRGDLSQVYVEGEHGTVFLVSARDEAVLVAVAARGAKAGLMLYEVRRIADDVGAVLQEDLAEPSQPAAPEPAYQPAPAEPMEPAGYAPLDSAPDYTGHHPVHQGAYDAAAPVWAPHPGPVAPSTAAQADTAAVSAVS